MPNWCENYLTIQGPKDVVINFLLKHCTSKECTVYEFDFNKVIPEPITKEECPMDCLLDSSKEVRVTPPEDKPWFDWYSYHCSYWGTKWNACDSSCNLDLLDSGCLYIFFNTAWSPCEPIIHKLIELYPNLTIDYKYYEPGMGFAGRLIKEPSEELFSEEVSASDGDIYKEFLIRNELESLEYFEELEEAEKEDIKDE